MKSVRENPSLLYYLYIEDVGDQLSCRLRLLQAVQKRATVLLSSSVFFLPELSLVCAFRHSI
jgi:hypothetical protein